MDNNIKINKKILKESWLTIILIHVLFLSMSAFPIIDIIKSKNIFYGLLMNMIEQIILILFIFSLLKEFLFDSWKNFLYNGIKNNIKYLFKGLFIFIFIYACFYIIISFLSIEVSSNKNQSIYMEYFVSYPIIINIMSIFIGPFTEECIYRGIVFQTFRGYNKYIAILGSAAMFGIMHAISSICNKDGFSSIQIIFIIINYAIPGVGLAIIQEKYKNIWINYLVHMGWNSLGFILRAIVKLLN